MIRYALVCTDGHEFDSWFPGSAAYDEQVRRGFVECPVCHTKRVTKAIMAPRVARTDNLRTQSLRTDVSYDHGEAGSTDNTPDESPPAPPMPMVMDERLIALRSMIHEMRATITKNTTDVGAAFPDEARKMHNGEIDHKPIRGEATIEEVRELIEDGVPIMPVPILPDERN